MANPPNLIDPIGDINSDARANIDQEIQRLTEQIRSLRSARNELAPISRLPVEILRTIFLLFGNPWWDCDPVEDPRLISSWVSRKWRNLALGIPHLWSTIDFTNLERIDTCLIRARNVPLVVNLNFDQHPVHFDFLPPILAVLPQICSLTVSADHETERSMPFEMWNNRAPQLTSLIIRGISLPIDVFQNIPPPLKFLELEFCDFRLDPFPASDILVELIIRWPDSPLLFLELLEILKESPNLGKLDLCQAIDPFQSTYPPPPEIPLFLSNLHQLSLENHCFDISQPFFQHIVFPPGITLNVEVDIENTADFLTIIQTVVSCGQLTQRSYKTFKIGAGAEYSVFQLMDYHGESTGGSPWIELSFEFQNMMIDLPTIFRSLDPLLRALINVDRLIMGGRDLHGADQPFPYFQTFSKHEHLHSLELISQFFPLFLQFVASTFQLAGANTAGFYAENFVHFPVLSKLILAELKDISPDQHQCLCAWLQWRMENYCRLPTLEFERCQIEPSRIEAWNFGKVVGEVVIGSCNYIPSPLPQDI